LIFYRFFPYGSFFNLEYSRVRWDQFPAKRFFFFFFFFFFFSNAFTGKCHRRRSDAAYKIYGSAQYRDDT